MAQLCRFGQDKQRDPCEEITANMRKGELVWRETDDGHGVTLFATDAGLAVVGIEPEISDAP